MTHSYAFVVGSDVRVGTVRAASKGVTTIGASPPALTVGQGAPDVRPCGIVPPVLPRKTSDWTS